MCAALLRNTTLVHDLIIRLNIPTFWRPFMEHAWFADMASQEQELINAAEDIDPGMPRATMYDPEVICTTIQGPYIRCS